MLHFAEFQVDKASDQGMRIVLERADVETALDVAQFIGKAVALDKTCPVRW